MSRHAHLHRHSIIAALCLVFSLTAAPCLVSASLSSGSPLIRAAAFLLGPLSFLVWIVTTVRSLHILGLGYWSLASTYVVLLAELAAVVLAVLAGSVHTQRSATDIYETLLCSAALTDLTGMTWSVGTIGERREVCWSPLT
jgi:hypothetical protein